MKTLETVVDKLFCRKKRSKNSSKNYEEVDCNSLTKIYTTHNFAQGESSKKIDCQDAFAIIDWYAPEFYFFAVLDGHGSSGKEASNAGCDLFRGYIESSIDKIKSINSDRETDNFLNNGKKFFLLPYRNEDIFHLLAFANYP